jgi:phosphoribosyl 1,2-cyclic phosphate phosphodiesterase
LLVDCGPDLRQQLLAAELGAVDGVLVTHGHADHCHGIDDLRQVAANRGELVPLLRATGTLAGLATDSAMCLKEARLISRRWFLTSSAVA